MTVPVRGWLGSERPGLVEAHPHLVARPPTRRGRGAEGRGVDERLAARAWPAGSCRRTSAPGRSTAPAGSIACILPWSDRASASIPPPGSITSAERLASGSWISSPPIRTTPLGSLVLGLKKSPLMPATTPVPRRAATAPVSEPRVTGDCRRPGPARSRPAGSAGAHDVHHLPVVLRDPLVGDAGRHLLDRGRTRGREGLDRRRERRRPGTSRPAAEDRYQGADHRREANHGADAPALTARAAAARSATLQGVTAALLALVLGAILVARTWAPSR